MIIDELRKAAMQTVENPGVMSRQNFNNAATPDRVFYLLERLRDLEDTNHQLHSIIFKLQEKS